MSVRRWILAVAVGLAGCQVPGASVPLPEPGTYTAGVLLVGFAPGTSAQQAQEAIRRAEASSLEPLATDLWAVQVPAGREREFGDRLAAQPGVRYAELDRFVSTRMVGGFTPAAAPRRVAALGDPLVAPEPLGPGGAKKTGLPGQWAFKAINADAAWTRSTGAKITVAVLDTGADMGHEDLAANLDTANAYNFVENNATPDDDYGHGTHVAGIIAAVADNGVGIKGVAYGARVMPIRVLGVEGGSTANVIKGIDWAISHHAQVINMSLGSNQYSRAEAEAVARALAAGVVVVAAAGNEALGGNPLSYPGAIDGVISVAALKATFDSAWSITALERGDFSNFNPFVTVAAPGVDILSTVPRRFQRTNGGEAPYAYASGTSMASPVVAGVVALMLSAKTMTPAAVASRLRRTARDLGSAGQDLFFGAGVVQADGALP